MEYAHLAPRFIDRFGIDSENINVNSTDTLYAMRARIYCYAGHVPACPMEWATIKYRPTMAGNVIYLLCFIALLGGQLFFGIRKKTWTYMGTISMGIVGEMVGYIARLLLNHNPWSMDLFLANLVPLTIAPALLTAGIYLCLSRVIVAVGAGNSRLKPKMYTYVFIGFDLLALVLQAIGGGMAATAKDGDGSQQGVNIMIAGLVSQVISMAIFFVVWGDFVLRTHRAKRAGTLQHMQPPLYAYTRSTKAFKLFQWSLFVAAVLIFIRCVYRVAELWQGFNGDLANDEATFMVFEGPMIILALAGMTVFHPGRVFDDLWVAAGKGMESQKLASGSSTELTAGESWGNHGNTAYERV